METSTSHGYPEHAPPGELEFRLSVHADRQQPPADVRRNIWAVLRAEATAREAGGAGDGAGEGAGAGSRWGTSPGSLGVVIAVDFAQDRLDATHAAVAAAIAALPDGVRFGLLEDRTDEHGVPRQPEWQVADLWQRSRVQATARWMQLSAPPEGGTSYSNWLARARAMFAGDAADAADVRHLLMITDGTAGRTPQLSAELDACAGEFTCDVLGVGDHWQPDVLTGIAERLHGTAECVGGGEEVTAWLTGMVDRLLSTRVPMVPLEVTLRPGVELVDVLQLAPVRRPLEPLGPLTPLTPLSTPDDETYGKRPGRPRKRAYATRLWSSADVREYELVLSADPTGDPLDEELQLAAVTLGPASESVLVRWSYERGGAADPGTLDGGSSPPAIFHGQHTALAVAFKEGCQALGRGEASVARQQLGAAAQLAHNMGNTAFLDRVRRVAEVLDAERGQVRLRPFVDPGELLATQMYSNRVPLSPADEDGMGSPLPEQVLVDCPRQCGRRSGQGARYCVNCGATL